MKLPENSVLRITDQPLSLKGAISLAGVNDLALMDDVHHLRLSEFGKENNHPVTDLLGTPKEVPERYEGGFSNSIIAPSGSTSSYSRITRY